MEFLAKSFPVETINKHTSELLKRLRIFKEVNSSQIPFLSDRDWELLELAVKYHDIGKANIIFQEKIRRSVEKRIFEKDSNEIPHNYLSVMAIPFKVLGFNNDESHLIAQIVGYHHERGVLPPKEKILTQYREKVLPLKEEIEQEHRELQILIDDKATASKMNKVNSRILPEHHLYYRYVLLKGILHRLDHAASAHVPIELAHHMDVSVYVTKFLQEKLQVNKNPLQVFTESHQNEHLVIVAQTGMGKTEAGLLWLGNKKGFFTLPLRVSINAMYSRIISKDTIGFSSKNEENGEVAVGLLHSTSLDYLYDQEEGNDEVLEKVHAQSQEFANKLVISTIDQILKFPFYYLGFEKEYSTMASSKVIIDELQAYDPKIAAVLIRALTMIDQVGGSFMIMTATLPDFYFKALNRELKSSKRPISYKEFIDDTVKRHHVKIRKESIKDKCVIDEIKENSESKKVLVICNTIDRACELYDELNELGTSVKLLHARFINKDRSRLEKEIIDFATSSNCGVWITTQLVEASLDIDFDLLYTEMSTLDSQFQRYGRCNRKGLKEIEQVNVHVFTKDVSGVDKSGGVYHYEIFQDSVRLLEGHQEGLLLETTKQEMIKELYDEERLNGINSEFKSEFDKALKELKERPHYDLELTKGKAQYLLRDILQVQVIPNSFNNDEEFQLKLAAWKSAKSSREKRRCRKKIEEYSVGVKKYRAEKIGLTDIEGIKGLHFIHCPYDNDKGLILEPDPFD